MTIYGTRKILFVAWLLFLPFSVSIADVVEIDKQDSLLEYSQKQSQAQVEIDAQADPCAGTSNSGVSSKASDLYGGNSECQSEKPEPIYKKATYTGSIRCEKEYPKKGDLGAAFRHSASDYCYSCPKGYERSLNPNIKAKDACIKVIEPVTKKAKAKFLSKTTISKPHDKAFKDPRNGGEWWRCPNTHDRRTLEKVNGAKACAKGTWPDEKLTKAIFISKVNVSQPSNNAFKDPRKGGEWWECPKGYDRTASAVTAKDACIKNVPKKIEKAKATERGYLSGICETTSFLHRLTGDCYSCPPNFERSLNNDNDKRPDKNKKACISYPED